MQASPRPRGAGIPTGSKGTLGFIFFELQSRNVQESRTWLILCRARREEERKAENKQSRRTSWLAPPSQLLHPPVLRTGSVALGLLPAAMGVFPAAMGVFLPSHPSPSQALPWLCLTA